jgi:hypothetical protein
MLHLAGGLLWSPLLCAVLMILLAPSSSSMKESKEEAIREAVERVR